MEINNQNTNEHLTKKIQKQTLLMLKSLQKILDQHDIPFFLACGTALGAARHGGFIPWDDDVDLYVKGEDLPRLKEVFAKEDTGSLVLHDFDTVKNYPYWFPKIVDAQTLLVEEELTHIDYRCGIYIDIFPLISPSDSKICRFFSEKKRFFEYTVVRMSFLEQHSDFRKLLKKGICACCSPLKAQKRLYRMYIRKRNSKKYFLDGGTFKKQALLEKSSFDEKILMPFEDAQMPMPKDYHRYLSDYYGNYRELPPEDSRVSNHHFAQIEFKKE